MRAVFAVIALFAAGASARGQDVSSKEVLRSIDLGKRHLIGRQEGDGAWSSDYGKIGPTSLAVLALLNAGEAADSPAVARGLEFLGSTRSLSRYETYEAAVLIMALAAAGDPQDRPRIADLAGRIEAGQILRGPDTGLWSYELDGRKTAVGGTQADRSNGQFAVLGLREAAWAGVPVSRKTWERVRDDWLGHQNGDGGWGYSREHRRESYGSMTAAGIATLSVVETMLRDDALTAEGAADCCASDRDVDIAEALERAQGWMAKNFAVRTNPRGDTNVLYYQYGLERAGRLSGRRFFGEHDWYREGAGWLVTLQSPRDGGWRGEGSGEHDTTLGTAFTLLFLSKGLSPVIVNKLKYGSDDEADVAASWNAHPDDARNLVEYVAGREGWPRLLTWQVADLEKAAATGSVGELLQAPVLYVTGRDGPPQPSAAEAALLRSYLDEGGFLFAVAGCDRGPWDAGMRELVAKLYPNGEAALVRLGPDHPIYQAEFLFKDPGSIELWGLDVGCRTALVYSPDDLGCLWDRWRPFDVPGCAAGPAAAVEQKLRVGTNVLAYATGRQPPGKLDVDLDPAGDGEADPVERGLLQVAKLRHGGAWDAAPRALSNLLRALNERVGLAASMRHGALVATDPDLYKYPLVTMHGRAAFSLSPKEVERLREHLDRGAVLFADACCGSAAFDASFRGLAGSLYPDRPLKRIPIDHELFTAAVGEDLSEVRRREKAAGGPLRTEVVAGPPFLEGIEIDGRLAVIYSKYDISCALENQSSAACAGYLPEDALRIAVNVVLYAMLQDVAAAE